MINARFIRFALVGLVNTVVGYSAILLLQQGIGLSPVPANAGGYLIGMVLSYFLNRYFTFASSRPHRHAMPRFFAVVAACFAVNFAVLNICLWAFPIPPALAQAVAVASYTVAFYFASKKLVFTNGLARERDMRQAGPRQ